HLVTTTTPLESRPGLHPRRDHGGGGDPGDFGGHDHSAVHGHKTGGPSQRGPGAHRRAGKRAGTIQREHGPLSHHGRRPEGAGGSSHGGGQKVARALHQGTPPRPVGQRLPISN